MPELVAQYHDARRARRVFVRREGSAEHGAGPEQLEEVRGDVELLYLLRLAAAAGVDASGRGTQHGEALEERCRAP